MRASTNPELVHAFAAALLARREELARSQEQVAVKAGIDRAYISRLEAGAKNPSLSILRAIATGLDLTLVELAGLIEERYQIPKPKRSRKLLPEAGG